MRQTGQIDWKWSEVKDRYDPNYSGYLFGAYTPKIDFKHADLNNSSIYSYKADDYINLTAGQIVSAGGFGHFGFKNLSLTYDFMLRASIYNSDLSRCTFADDSAKKVALFYQATDNSANVLPSSDGVTLSPSEFLNIIRNPKPNGILTSGSYALPSEWISFAGTESFSGIRFMNMDISSWTGVTVSQLLSADGNYALCKLPSVTFTGTEDLSGISFQYADISRLQGLTTAQLSSMSVSSLKSVRMSSAQYAAFKNTLKAKGVTAVYVDGKFTVL